MMNMIWWSQITRALVMVIFGMDYYVQPCNALDLILIFALTYSAMSFKNILGTCCRSQVSSFNL